MSTEELEIVWKGVMPDLHTTEHVTVRWGEHILVTSAITGTVEEKLVRGRYQLQLDAKWQLQYAAIATHKQTYILQYQQRCWIKNGVTESGLQGCEYIDINLTPFTNALPINRLKLAPGQRQEIQVVYIDLIRQEVKPVWQRYTRTDATHYLYEGLDSGFTRTLTVDDNGIVVDYPSLWIRST